MSLQNLRHLKKGVGKPYTVPNDDAPAETFIRCYWWDISREPRLLANLRHEDGSLYLEQRQVRKHPFTHTKQARNEQTA